MTLKALAEQTSQLRLVIACSTLQWNKFSPKLFGADCFFLIILLTKFKKWPFNQNNKLTTMEAHLDFGHTL